MAAKTAKAKGKTKASRQASPLTKTRKRNGRKRNAEENALQAAAEMYEQFHGRPAKGVRNVEEIYRSRSTVAECGRLIDLGVWLDEDRFIVLKPRGVIVGTTSDGGALYFLEGDQQLDLEGMGLAEYLPKDFVKVGDVETICYRTSKSFHNFEPKDYEHEFGEEGGELPTLNYDCINDRLFLVGGSYQVRPQGIVN